LGATTPDERKFNPAEITLKFLINKPLHFYLCLAIFCIILVEKKVPELNRYGAKIWFSEKNMS
jgi:hypothetical protein